MLHITAFSATLAFFTVLLMNNKERFHHEVIPGYTKDLEYVVSDLSFTFDAVLVKEQFKYSR